jgi:hypothetical protein
LSKLLGGRLQPEGASLTEQQKEIYQVLLAASKRLGSDGSFTYLTEWLGWLPYGQYNGVYVQGERVSDLFPDNWGLPDLDALVVVGLAERLGERTYGKGETDKEVSYRLRRAPSSLTEDGRNLPTG